MTNEEFKAWFEGFSEGVNGVPTPHQWNKIKDKVATINSTPYRFPVYVNRTSYPDYWRWQFDGPTCQSATVGDSIDPKTALYNLGMQEAKS